MVDYTVPDVIHDMVDLYIKHKTPFVMGTTGGDRAKILSDVAAADLYAVIAPQMGKQVGLSCRRSCGRIKRLQHTMMHNSASADGLLSRGLPRGLPHASCFTAGLATASWAFV